MTQSTVSLNLSVSERLRDTRELREGRMKELNYKELEGIE